MEQKLIIEKKLAVRAINNVKHFDKKKRCKCMKQKIFRKKISHMG
jgi:hypothetical protein